MPWFLHSPSDAPLGLLPPGFRGTWSPQDFSVSRWDSRAVGQQEELYAWIPGQLGSRKSSIVDTDSLVTGKASSREPEGSRLFTFK